MLDLERVVLAALLHDLPSLLARLPGERPQGLDAVLHLAKLDGPALQALVGQAEQYAAPEGQQIDRQKALGHLLADADEDDHAEQTDDAAPQSEEGTESLH